MNKRESLSRKQKWVLDAVKSKHRNWIVRSNGSTISSLHKRGLIKKPELDKSEQFYHVVLTSKGKKVAKKWK